MELHLYNPDDVLDESLVVRDIEKCFLGLSLKNDNVTRHIMKEIDGAEYLSKTMFKDRYGVAVYMSCLSTGCKAALCVHYLPDKVIDLKECGINARDAVLWHCKNGNAIFYDAEWGVSIFGRDSVATNIWLDGRCFTSMPEFNDYIVDEK